jgi:hypothetical protein
MHFRSMGRPHCVIRDKVGPDCHGGLILTLTHSRYISGIDEERFGIKDREGHQVTLDTLAW